MMVQHVGHAQPVLQQAHDVGARDDAAEHAELGFALEGVEQHPQRLAEERIAEIREPGQAASAVEQRRRAEIDQGHPDAAQGTAGAIEDAQPDGLRRPGLNQAVCPLMRP